MTKVSQLNCDSKTVRLWYAAIVAALSIGLSSSAHATIMSIQSLGTLPGGTGVRPFAISYDGTIIVGAAGHANNINVGFRWTHSNGFVELPPLAGHPASVARDISPDGSVVVGNSVLFNGNRGVKWSGSNDPQLLQTNAGTPFLEAMAVSANGDALVGRAGQNGYLINQTGSHLIPGLAQFQYTYPWDISNDGTTVVGVSTLSNGLPRAVRWTQEGGLENLGTFGAFPGSCATQISADKSTITGWVDRGNGDLHTFRWTADNGMQKLDALPGYGHFTPGGISHDGRIIVGNSNAFGGNRAFIWTPELGFEDLNNVFASVLPSNWTLVDAMISDDGRVLTGMMSVGGQYVQGWVGTIPEPSTGVLMLAVLAAICTKRKGS